MQGRTPRDWVVDVGAVLLACGWGVGAVFTTHLASRLDSPLAWLDLMSGSLACLAVWFRRAHPVGLACALLPVAAFSSIAGMASGIVLFTVAVHRHYPAALGMGLLYAVAKASNNFLRPDQWANLPKVLLVYALLIATGMFVRARRQLVLSLRERARQAETDSMLRIEQARALERERIAREMHDVLAHRISLLSLHAGALGFRRDATAEEVTRAAEVIRGSAHEILRDLRDIIGVLRGQPDEQTPSRRQPTIEDVPDLIEQSRSAGTNIELANRISDRDKLPGTIGRNVYRIVQEGLTNARKHAPDCAVTVTLQGSPSDGLSIDIVNRLPVGSSTVPKTPGSGLGLVGMKERASLAGGRLDYARTLTHFQLSAWLPWQS
jgi:signal transduction histidine kinase